MNTDRAVDNQQGDTDHFAEDHLNAILAEYESLSEIQLNERKILLDRIDALTERISKTAEHDSKLAKFNTLLLDIRAQIAGTPTPKEPITTDDLPPVSEVVATENEIESLTEEVHSRSEILDQEIDSLTHLLDKKRADIESKDQSIEEMNDRLDMLTREKSRLAEELEKMHDVFSSWKNQLELMHKLATSDPRYRVIDTLKKHGSLSDIQLAFIMGTSIHQLRKYLEDLTELDLVQQSSDGRYNWTGQQMDTDN